MEKRKLFLKIVLAYVPVLFIFTIALILKQPAILRGGGEMPYGFFIMIIWPQSVIISSLLQPRLNTKWMWLAPFVISLLWTGLHFENLLGLPAYLWALAIVFLSLVPSFLGLFVGIFLSRKKDKAVAN